MNKKIEILTIKGCNSCLELKDFLNSNNKKYIEYESSIDK